MADRSHWIKARQTRYGAFVALYLVVILAVIVAANWLADHHNKSVDVTANKQFTLSDETKKVTGNLKHDVTIYYFDKSDTYDRARDMLDRYKNLSSKIKVDYVDPDKKPDVARVEGARAMGDIIVDNGEKKETAKGLTEEELTGALVRASKSGARRSASSTAPASTRSTIPAAMAIRPSKTRSKRTTTRPDTISLIEKPEIPKTCTIVVVGGPKHDYLQPAIDALKTFVTGRRPRDLQLRSGAESARNEKMGDTPNLAALVSDWGVTPNGDVILDLSSASRLFGQISPVVGSTSSIRSCASCRITRRSSRSPAVSK